MLNSNNKIEVRSDSSIEKPKIREVSLLMFVDENNNLLFQDRHDISKFGEEYGFFGGGFEEGEDAVACLKREILQELTYDIKDFKFFKVYETPHSAELHFKEHIFIAKFPGFEKFDQKEGNNMVLLSIDEAKQLRLINSYYKILDDLEKYLNTQS